MKINLLYRYLLAVVIFCASLSRGNAQGVDVIFWLDNSGSMTTVEWNAAASSIRSLIDEVITCNGNNRVAVVHYGSTGGAPYSDLSAKTRIYIETNFINDATTAKSFVKRSSVGGSDDAHTALGVIGDALDATPNSKIVSPQTVLSRNPNNKLVIFLFTDALRAEGSSYLVNGSNTGAAAFTNYNTFKSSRGAQFVVLKGPPASTTSSSAVAAAAAAAAIASTGGAYAGAVESNPGDPQGSSGAGPRKMIYSSSFTANSSELALLEEDICRSCAPLLATGALTPATQTICSTSSPAPLVVTATGTGVLGYQWYSNTVNNNSTGTLIPGATSSSYTPPPAGTNGTTYYYVIVTDSQCNGTASSDPVSITTSTTLCASAALDCQKTQLTPAPEQGTPTQSYLIVTANVTTAGDLPVTVSGSGFSLYGINSVTATATGIQQFKIPVKYDGSALGTLTFGVGTSSCTANLAADEVVNTNCDTWTLEKCTPQVIAPVLK